MDPEELRRAVAADLAKRPDPSIQLPPAKPAAPPYVYDPHLGDVVKPRPRFFGRADLPTADLGRLAGNLLGTTEIRDERVKALRGHAAYKPILVRRTASGPDRQQLNELRGLDQTLDRYGAAQPTVTYDPSNLDRPTRPLRVIEQAAQWDPARVSSWLKAQNIKLTPKQQEGLNTMVLRRRVDALYDPAVSASDRVSGLNAAFGAATAAAGGAFTAGRAGVQALAPLARAIVTGVAAGGAGSAAPAYVQRRTGPEEKGGTHAQGMQAAGQAIPIGMMLGGAGGALGEYAGMLRQARRSAKMGPPTPAQTHDLRAGMMTQAWSEVQAGDVPKSLPAPARKAVQEAVARGEIQSQEDLARVVDAASQPVPGVTKVKKLTAAEVQAAREAQMQEYYRGNTREPGEGAILPRTFPPAPIERTPSGLPPNLRPRPFPPGPLEPTPSGLPPNLRPLPPIRPGQGVPTPAEALAAQQQAAVLAARAAMAQVPARQLPVTGPGPIGPLPGPLEPLPLPLRPPGYPFPPAQPPQGLPGPLPEQPLPLLPPRPRTLADVLAVLSGPRQFPPGPRQPMGGLLSPRPRPSLPPEGSPPGGGGSSPRAPFPPGPIERTPSGLPPNLRPTGPPPDPYADLDFGIDAMYPPQPPGAPGRPFAGKDDAALRRIIEDAGASRTGKGSGQAEAAQAELQRRDIERRAAQKSQTRGPSAAAAPAEAPPAPGPYASMTPAELAALPAGHLEAAAKRLARTPGPELDAVQAALNRKKPSGPGAEAADTIAKMRQEDAWMERKPAPAAPPARPIVPAERTPSGLPRNLRPRQQASPQKEPWQMTRAEAQRFIPGILQSREAPGAEFGAAKEARLKLEEGKLAKLKRLSDRNQLPQREDILAVQNQEAKVAALRAEREAAADAQRAAARDQAAKLLREYPDLFEPWESYPYVSGTKRYSEFSLTHKDAVRRALREGKPVPREVLADYPDLVPAAKAAAPTPEPKPSLADVMLPSRKAKSPSAPKAKVRFDKPVVEGGRRRIVASIDPPGQETVLQIVEHSFPKGHFRIEKWAHGEGKHVIFEHDLPLDIAKERAAYLLRGGETTGKRKPVIGWPLAFPDVKNLGKASNEQLVMLRKRYQSGLEKEQAAAAKWETEGAPRPQGGRLEGYAFRQPDKVGAVSGVKLIRQRLTEVETEMMRRRETGLFAAVPGLPPPGTGKAVRQLIDAMLAHSRRGAAARPQTTGAARFVRELAATIRGSVLGGDVGILGRQGAVAAASHPVTYARAIGAGIRGAGSDAAMETALNNLAKRWLGNMPSSLVNTRRRAAGLQLTNTTTNREELLLPHLAAQLPVIGERLGSLERFQAVFINTLRADLHDPSIRAGWTPAEQALRARWINSMTGRGNLGDVHALAELALTSPRYETSRWEMLSAPFENGAALVADLAKGRVNRAAVANLSEMAAAAGALVGMYELASKAGYTVNWTDYNSPDFLAMRKGQEVWNPTAGVSQRLRDVLRVMAAGGFLPGAKGSAPGNTAKDVIGGALTRAISPAIRTPYVQASRAIQRSQGVAVPRDPVTGYRDPDAPEGLWAFAPLVAQTARTFYGPEGAGKATEVGVKEVVGTSVQRYPRRPGQPAPGPTPLQAIMRKLSH